MDEVREFLKRSVQEVEEEDVDVSGHGSRIQVKDTEIAVSAWYVGGNIRQKIGLDVYWAT